MMARSDGDERTEDGANAPSAPSFSAASRKGYVQWTGSEILAIRQHPDMTASELHEIIPRHSVKAIRHQRDRLGRYTPDVTPLCQRCGEHPVWDEAADARRWGLCKACALEERAWRERHRGDLDRKDNAIRQARFKSRHRKKGGR